jgi:hypothetical protein
MTPHETADRVLEQRLMRYALAAGAALACQIPAHGEVIFTPSSALFQGIGKVDIDLDNDGSGDFRLLIKSIPYDTSNSVQALFVYGNRGSNRIGGGGRGEAVALEKKTRIGAGEDL